MGGGGKGANGGQCILRNIRGNCLPTGISRRSKNHVGAKKIGLG